MFASDVSPMLRITTASISPIWTQMELNPEMTRICLDQQRLAQQVRVQIKVTLQVSVQHFHHATQGEAASTYSQSPNSSNLNNGCVWTINMRQHVGHLIVQFAWKVCVTLQEIKRYSTTFSASTRKQSSCIEIQASLIWKEVLAYQTANEEISSFELGSSPASNVRISYDQCSKLPTCVGIQFLNNTLQHLVQSSTLASSRNLKST